MNQMLKIAICDDEQPIRRTMMWGPLSCKAGRPTEIYEGHGQGAPPDREKHTGRAADYKGSAGAKAGGSFFPLTSGLFSESTGSCPI